MSIRVLVAEDDTKQAELLRVFLKREGYAVTVVHNGRAAIDGARSSRPHAVVLDIMMPDVDGLDVCRVLRRGSDVPILLLTARSAENDKLLGFDLGADDYVTKPYSPRELTARVRALIRRSGTADGTERAAMTVGDLEVDPARFEVRRAGRHIALTAKEFGILHVLASRPGRVFTRAEIIDHAFAYDSDVLARTVDAHIMNIRRKLDDDPSQPRYLQTVHGRGYRIADPESMLADTRRTRWAGR